MEIEAWWPKLSAPVREWLAAHNGDVVPPTIVEAIVEAAGPVGAEERWFGESGPDGFFLSEEATDWIEATANDET
jgi:hypothetical protein